MQTTFSGNIQTFVTNFYSSKKEDLLKLEEVILQYDPSDADYLRNPDSFACLVLILSRCEKLRKFQCGDNLNKVINTIIYAIKELTYLESLEIECAPKNLTAQSLDFLCKLINLKTLSILDQEHSKDENVFQKNCIDKVILVLETCKELNALFLHGVHLDKLSDPNKGKLLSAIAEMPKLRKLSLSMNSLPLKEINVLLSLGKLKNIEYLDLCGNMGEVEVEKEDLSLFVSLLSEFESLNHLDLDGCSLSESEHFYSLFSPLFLQLKSLKQINVNLSFKTKVGDEFRKFAYNLSRNNNIEDITFNDVSGMAFYEDAVEDEEAENYKEYRQIMEDTFFKMENLMGIEFVTGTPSERISFIIERNKLLHLLPKKDNDPKSLLFLASKVVANSTNSDGHHVCNTNKLPFDLQCRIENYRATSSKEYFVNKLFDCIENQNLGLFTYLIASNKTWKKWDLNTKDANGQTLLHRASSKNEEGVASDEGFLKVLLENGADPTIKDAAGETPYQYAQNQNLQTFIEVYTNYFAPEKQDSKRRRRN